MRLLLLATLAQHTHGLTLQRRRLGQLSAAAAVAAVNRPAGAARIASEGFAFDAPAAPAGGSDMFAASFDAARCAAGSASIIDSSSL